MKEKIIRFFSNGPSDFRWQNIMIQCNLTKCKSCDDNFLAEKVNSVRCYYCISQGKKINYYKINKINKTNNNDLKENI